MKKLLLKSWLLGLLLVGLARAGAPTGITLTINSPADQDRFTVGVPISIQATAVDPQGAILRLEFLAGFKQIGVSEIFTLVPVPPGEPVHHEFLWKDAPAGTHVLTVRAKDGTDFGAVSAPVVIQIGEAGSSARLRIVHPADLAVFHQGDDVPVVAEAEDPAGLIGTVGFYANGVLIGETHFDPCPPCDQPPCPERPCVEPPAGTVLTHSFIWTKPPPGKYALEARGTNAAGQLIVSPAIRLAVTEAPSKASLTFDAPAAGAAFATPGEVPMQVTAVDPLGEIRRVEFFAGDHRLGVSEILTKDAIIPGRPRTHQFTWTNPPAGEFKLHAWATTAAGDLVGSEAVPVHVRAGGGELPTLTITTVKSPAFEQGDRKSQAGIFRVERHGGDLTREIHASYILGGTATLGADYQFPGISVEPGRPDPAGTRSRTLVIPAGHSSMDIQFSALPDAQLEGTETVVATLVEQPLAGVKRSPLPAEYFVGEPHQATVEIRDLGAGAATVVITAPVGGDAFKLGEAINIDTVGQDPESLVSTVEFFANGAKIGERCFLCVVDAILPPGTPLHNALEWTPAKPGEYVLTAVGQFGADKRVKSAPVTIRVGASEPKPSLTITDPAGGAVVRPDDIIKVVAVGVGRFGGITDVELLLDGRRIAESRISFFRPPGVDEPVQHAFEVRIPEGEHRLVVRDETDPAVVSPAIVVRSVREGPRVSAVRTLPGSFLPGAKFTVSLKVEVADGVQNYVVEEHPPYVFVGGAVPPPDVPRWDVTAVSDDGVYDVSNGAVKFGPFFDHQPRTLTYEITPNEAAIEMAEFAGWVVADGHLAKTGGDRVLAGNRHHPADRDPADDAIGAVELTAYGAAWKAGLEWPRGPHPIPMDYVTRAGLLWRRGERYLFDPAAGPAPLCWVSNPFLPPAVPGDTAESGNTSAAAPKFHGVALRSVKPAGGTSVEIAVRILPAPGINVYAVEEHLAGTPAFLGGDGSFDAGSRTIRWGPFLDRQPRTLTYRLEGTDAGRPAYGVVSFDGASVAVKPSAPPDAAGPRLVGLEPMEDGAMQVVVEDEALGAGAGYDLEVSTDLQRWTRTGGFVNEHSAAFARDETPAADGPRFYRAVRVK